MRLPRKWLNWYAAIAVFPDASADVCIAQRQQGKKIDEEVLNLPPEVFGRPKAPAGTWGSCIRIVDPVEAKTVQVIPLEDNEAAFSLAVVPFSARGGELHLVVGTAADTHVSPRTCSSGFLRTYKFVEDGAGLEVVHKVSKPKIRAPAYLTIFAPYFFRPKSTMFLLHYLLSKVALLPALGRR